MWLSRIHPKSISNKIPQKKVFILYNSIRHVLLKAISNNGTTIINYTYTEGKTGNNADELNIYGKKGFYQYQSVIPKKNSHDATIEMLDIIKSSGEGSFLAVLKTFDNKKSLGLLSFPMEGTTLALDFPNKGPNTLKLFQKLDEVVMKSGGRIYMAKDNRMSREMFEAGYPNYEKFKEYIDPGISSSMSRRLFDF